MDITVVGTGYVGLVTGVCFAEIGYNVTCFDIDDQKISTLSKGRCPIYEPGLEEVLNRNLNEGRLHFTADLKSAFARVAYIFVAVGTPENEDGSANLDYLEAAVADIGANLTRDAVVVIKSTVPVGTNERIDQMLQDIIPDNIQVKVVSNPEFLREGSGILDTFHADRIVIGTDDREAGGAVASIYEPYGRPIIQTDIRSAELIKYASNAFLATKISFINEVANLCEHTGANIEDVSKGMGMDERIGSQFLKAGIGYGGSCFPKDTKALEKLTEYYNYDFKILRSVIEVNSRQKQQLFLKAKKMLGSMRGKRVAVLGLAFKPHTDDIREAPAMELIAQLLEEQADISVYDPAAVEKVEELYGSLLYYADSVDMAIKGADVVFIMTEWPQITEYDLERYPLLTRESVVFDGRNCYDLAEAEAAGLTYISVGRRAVNVKWNLDNSGFQG
ncbi:UDP-glucose/GDP-mannose dehydrogenase family protein [Bacillus sp. ISL-55]|uniref:UDP-glucose dehydrogenase family protein n=1 Tax=Bacillus sp. ISL-55 TaxID=2819134 RepID=UPI001BE81C9B|nr:UDP-glucose/GDP-mannose dehydrogenase family protein [Bacillus sp. ISL-55]MBT2692265.1 UDP-glucose/GDP-mannose dehydrogenase family protein [Bacillus sp. ISL-55]